MADMYEYTVVYKGKGKDDADKVVVPPKSVMANDRSHAERLALREDAIAEYDDKIDQLEVKVRPFSNR